ncbi:MAG: hypothetical protein L0241_21620 [Planctomycetia bacterium]|nr:hypothetical protein [Planctomycetia bacterium]
MTPAEFKKLTTTIQEKLVELLGPLGIEVKHEAKNKQMSAEFTFKVQDRTPDGKTPGTYSELSLDLHAYEAQSCLSDPKYLDNLPHAWARILADWVPNVFDTATLPSAPELDWRPNETTPEDFGAA